jgi:uroporphyrinogen-III synthase
MNILITRAEDEGLSMAKEFESLGHTAVIDPMIKVKALTNWLQNYQLIKDNIELIIFTSKYAIREFASKEKIRTTKILVVGKKSLIEAKKHGFIDVEEAGGDANSLLKKVLAKKNVGKILYLSGENISLELDEILIKEGFDCARLEVYQVSYAPILKKTTETLLFQQKIDVIIIYSVLTAITFKKNILKLKNKIDFSCVKLFVLSVKIADELKILNFNEIFIYNSNKLLTECDIIKVINKGI